MKNKLLLLIFLLSVLPCRADHRPSMVGVAGVAAVIAAMYIIGEKFEKDGAFIGGLLLGAAGVSLVLASNDIVEYYDQRNGHTITIRW